MTAPTPETLRASVELKPCPFCGGRAAEHIPSFRPQDPCQIGCGDCEFWFKDQHYDVVLDQWNRRAADADHARLEAEVARMREAAPRRHSDDEAVEAFAVAMKAKMAASRIKGRTGWETCPEPYLLSMLREHINKGDMRDVGCIAMMVHLNRARAALAAGEPRSGTGGEVG